MLSKSCFRGHILAPARHTIRKLSCSAEPDQDVHDTVVVGGGVVGVSLAYHLARRGKDVLLLEKSELTAGSTWHAAGLVTLYHPSPNVKRVHYDSMNLYAQITAETGQEVGFHRPGSLRLAFTPHRMEEFRYALGRQGHKDAPLRLLSKAEIKEKVPILRMDDVEGGLFTPGEGHIDPYSLTQAIAIGARKHGAKIKQGSEVTGLEPRPDGGWDVTIPAGTIRANRVVNCSGFWGREIGGLAGLDLPLVPVQHQYLVTKSVAEVQALKKEIPVLRHLEGSFYLRMERDGLLIGPYENHEAMVQMEDWVKKGVPKDFGKELYPGDLDRLGPHLERCMEDFPCFANAEIQSVVNGPITYTPDLLPMVGPSLLPNMWLAVGFGYGIAHGGGVGKYLSSWMCDGEPPYELSEFDPLRYGKWTDIEYTLAKTRESYGMNNAFGYPHEEREAGRPTRRVTPIYHKLKKAGAHMGMSSGWEIPLWYSGDGSAPSYKPSFSRTNWQREQDREYQLITNKVGVADLSGFGKFVVSGEGSRQFLDHLVAGTVPRAGRTSLVHMLTPRGKVYAELTITAKQDGSFLAVTGGGSELHDLRYIQQIVRETKADVEIDNLTDKLGVLSIVGPNSEELLSRLTTEQVADWKFLDARESLIGGVNCMAVKITYTGELGWELYVEMKDMETLYDNIINKGVDLGLAHVGTRVINTLRIEKGFRAWGHEMNMDTTPIETGLMPFVRMKKKADFIGKQGLLDLLKSAQTRNLVHISISPEVDEFEPEGDETVLCEGKPVGFTTSGCWSPLVSGGLCMASVPCLFAHPGTELEVVLGGIPRPATVLPGPPGVTYSVRKATAKKN